MKTNSDKCHVTTDRKSATNEQPLCHSPLVTRHACRAEAERRRAFTLIELLVVISIMALIAAMIFPIAGAISRTKYLSVAKAELNQIIHALNDYQAKFGTYPPANPLNPALNPLYYELSGMTNVDVQGTWNYRTLDSRSTVTINNYTNTFNVGGAINCNQPGADIETLRARAFLSDLRENRIGIYDSSKNINVLITSVRGLDPGFKPLGQADMYPFCYAYPGTNNPNSYDLWIDLKISGKTNRICNWLTKPKIL